MKLLKLLRLWLPFSGKESAPTVLAPGIEITVAVPTLHFTAEETSRLNITAKDVRLHFAAEER